MTTQPDRTFNWSRFGKVMSGIIAFFAWVHPFSPSTASSSVENTLTTFCNALLKIDYQTAYDQDSSGTKRVYSEKDWVSAASANITARGGLVQCTVSNTSDDGSSGQGSLTYLFGNQHVTQTLVTLTNENGSWRIVSEKCTDGCS